MSQRRRVRHRRNPDYRSNPSGGSLLLYGVIGFGVYYLFAHPGALSSIFPASSGVNPTGRYVNGVYYPPGIAFPTVGQQVGGAALGAGIATLGGSLAQAIRNALSGPSSSTASSGAATGSVSSSIGVNPDPSPSLVVGASTTTAGDEDQTAANEQIAYADSIAAMEAQAARNIGSVLPEIQEVLDWGGA